MSKLTPKIILEGTRLTFKTEIAFSLNEHPRIVGPRKYRYHSPLVSAEWCAFTNFPWGRGLINFEPHEEPLAMETYATWVRLFELQRYYSWIVDRFYISAQAYRLEACGKRYDFRWIEERLVPLNFRLVSVISNVRPMSDCRRAPDTARSKEFRGSLKGGPFAPHRQPWQSPQPCRLRHRRGCREPRHDDGTGA